MSGTCDEKKESQIIVLGNAYNKSDFDMPGVAFVEVPYNAKNKVVCILWELFYVTKYYKKYNADRIIFPRGFAPISRKINDIIIIHDMIPFYYDRYYPGYFNKLENFYVMNRLKKSARKCKKVITISEASKKEIIQESGADINKIKVIYNGCNKMENPVRHPEKEEYIVAITSMLPHKNAAGILKAYDVYVQKKDNPLRLKVIGIDGCEDYQPSEKAEKLIDYYRFIKEDKDLHSMIAGARIFLFLSLVEGFGFPPIEAMQLGVPVVCSSYSSLPEVVGDAAVLVDPLKPDEIATALMDIEDNPERAYECIQKGKENIHRFDWMEIAKKYWIEIKNL